MTYYVLYMNTYNILFFYHIITYWVSCLLFSILSEYLHNTNNKIYHIVLEKRLQHTPPWDKVKKALVMSVCNQMVSYPMIYYLSDYCINEEFNKYTYDPVIIYFLQFAFYTITTDQWFYITHRFMHSNNFLYKNIHSIHHQWTYPIAVRTIYAHPVEHIVTNIGSIIAPALIWPSSLSFITFWVCIATFNAVTGHSGIHFPIFSNEKHDLHHRLLTYNYGTLGLSDRMYGTRRF